MPEHEQADNPELSKDSDRKLPKVTVDTLGYLTSNSEELIVRRALFKKEQPALTDFLAKYINIVIKDEDSREFAKVSAAIVYVLLRHEAIEAGHRYENKSGELCGLPEVDIPFIKAIEAMMADAKERQDFVSQSHARFKHLQPQLQEIIWGFMAQERSRSDSFTLYMFPCITHEVLERWLK